MRVAERLRVTIAQRFAGEGGSPMVTASLGVAAIPRDAADAKTLIAAADQAMYAAKAGGRNRVVLANTSPRVEGTSVAQRRRSTPRTRRSADRPVVVPESIIS